MSEHAPRPTGLRAARPTGLRAARQVCVRLSRGRTLLCAWCGLVWRADGVCACDRGVCRANNSHVACPRLHFRRIIRPHTDVSLGNCSYLNTCRNFNRCK